MNKRTFIPNFITCLNLFSGCMAVLSVSEGELVPASYWVFAAAVFDFLDGLAARWLNGGSEFGKQLDSLADMVTFGLVPGHMIFVLMKHTTVPDWACTFGFLITIFSALRLAKFNIDTRQEDSFIGLPTPANTLMVVSLPLILSGSSMIQFSDIILNYFFLLGFTILSSWLLVAEIRLFSLKFKSFGWKENQLRYIFLLMSVSLIFLLKFAAIPAVILLYIGISTLTPQTKTE